MKRIYGIILTFAALLFITACTADSTETARQSQQLQLSADFAGTGAQTRTATSDLQATHIDATNTVGAFIYRKDATAAVTVDGESYGYTNKEFTVISSLYPLYSPSQPIFPYKGTGDELHVDVYAYAPYNSTWTALTGTKTFAVKADQKTDANYLASDLLWATPQPDVAPSGSGPYKNLTMAFDHKLTKVILNISAGDGVSTSSLTDVDIKLTNVITSGTIDLTDGTVTNATGTGSRSDVTVFTYGRDQAGTASAAATGGSAIIYPHSTTELTAGGKIQLTIGTITYSANLKTTSITELEAGKKYTYNVSVASDGISLTATVNDWDKTEADRPVTPELQ